MLRATSNSLTKASVWKNTAIYSSIKHYTTPNATPAPVENNEKKPSLSQRLGGTGRGKIMEGASDPFASFLANAKKPRNNNNRNGTFTPRNRKPQQAEGQFADAAEQPKQQRPRNENNGNNNNNRNRNTRQNNNRQNDKQSADGASPAKENSNNNNNNSNNNRRNNNNKNNNNNRNNNAQNGGKKLNMRRSQQPQEVRTRRATTFIDKDIDWSSFETATLTTETSETIVASTEQDSDELVLKDIQGDYDRYLSTGSELKWPQMIQGETLSTLVGSNPTFDLQQKTAFLAALSNGTNGIPASARK